MRAFALLAGTLACLLLAARGKDGEVYPHPAAEVHEILAEADELPPVFGSDEPDVRLDSADRGAVSWILIKDDAELMRFVAKLEPQAENSTLVSLAVSAPSSGPHGDVEKRLKEHPEIRDLYLAAMREQVDSLLENRNYDMTRVFPAISRATAANIGSITKNMDAQSEAGRKRDQDNIHEAYAEDAAGQ